MVFDWADQVHGPGRAKLVKGTMEMLRACTGRQVELISITKQKRTSDEKPTKKYTQDGVDVDHAISLYATEDLMLLHRLLSSCRPRIPHFTARQGRDPEA